MNDWQRFGYNKPTNYYRLTQRIILKKLFKMILYGSIFFLAVFLLISKFIANDNENNLLPHEQDVSRQIFNSVYPLSAPVIDQIDGSIMYKLLAVADLDTKSRLVKTENKYSSYLLKGTLTLSENNKKAEIKFESQPTEISSQYSYGDRGMELSELVVFNGRLYTCDDRTGIVYEISLDKNLAIPWVILADGDGENTGKGFKCEWMAVKDKKLYVGGRFSFPGYMIFESCSWDEINQRWYFLPRRASNETYDEDLDEKRATNLLIYLDKDLMRVNHLKIGKVIPTRGYSSFKFVPNSSNQLIIALKSEENLGATRTFVNLFDVNGNILVKDILLSDNLKYEGIEFV